MPESTTTLETHQAVIQPDVTAAEMAAALAPEAAPSSKEAILAEMDRVATEPDQELEPQAQEEEEAHEIEIPEEEEEEEAQEPEVPEDEEVEPPRREGFDHLDPQERRVVELLGKGLSLSEANRAVYGAQDEEAPQEPEVDPMATVEEQITALQDEIEALDEADEDEFLDPAERRKNQKAYREKFIALAELKAERKLLAREQEQAKRNKESQAESARQTQIQNSFSEALTQYPDLGNPASELANACQEELQYLAATGSLLLEQPNFPLMVVRRMARSLGLKAASAATAPAGLQATPPAKPARRGVRPVPTGGAPLEEPKQALDRRIEAALKSGSKKEMEALLREAGTPFEALMKR